jgi:DNA (cytosine-5)-methyltransferase 1
MNCAQPTEPSVRYISMFSGIEAATAAWHQLGWTPIVFAEIEPFPSAVLKHHYPNITNVGDVTKHDWSQYRGMCDIVVGGPPCQAFSIAGLRKSLGDHRGNLSLEYVRAIHAIRPSLSVTENVPGWLSTEDNAFGCFLAGIVGADAPLCSPLERGRWPSAGMVAGPLGRSAWRVLDSQYFGVPQRRKRVFVVTSFVDWLDPAEILFEPRSVRRDTQKSRKTRQDIAPATGSCAQPSCEPVAFGGGNAAAIDVSTTLSAKGGVGRLDFESETLIAASCVGHGVYSETLPTMRAQFADAGGGSETLIAFNAREDPCATGDVAGALGSSSPQAQAIAFSCKDHGADAGEIAPTLRAMNHSGSHANAGGQVAVAVSLRGREGGATAELSGETMPALRTGGGGADKAHALTQMGVRRLLPVETERLQGFSDGYTRILWRGKAADNCPDGPRYRAVGNSMTVNVMHWLGTRLEAATSKSAPHTAAHTAEETTPLVAG